MRRRAAILGAVIVVGLAQLVIGSPTSPARANVGSNAYPHVLSTPSFVLDTPGILDIRLTSAEDKQIVALYRIYPANGTLQHSNDMTVNPHESREISVVVQDGGRMHVEIWSPRPALTLELEYDGTDEVDHTIAPGDVLRAKRT
jgi:hypothetical protein